MGLTHVEQGGMGDEIPQNMILMGLTYVEQGGMGDEIPQNMILMGLAHVEQGVWGMKSPTWNRGVWGMYPPWGMKSLKVMNPSELFLYIVLYRIHFLHLLLVSTMEMLLGLGLFLNDLWCKNNGILTVE